MYLATTLLYMAITVTLDRVTALNYTWHIFYEASYGTPAISGAWMSWNAAGANPDAGNIASSWYPVLGVYDSGDPFVISMHMINIAHAGVGTIIINWWGRYSYSDNVTFSILSAANSNGIKVAFQIAPYPRRTPHTVVSDIKYLSTKYGQSGALYRDPTRNNKQVFYIYGTEMSTGWESVKYLTKHYILLAQIVNIRWLRQNCQYFTGFYNYNLTSASNAATQWPHLASFANSMNLIWAPTIGPGQNATKVDPSRIVYDRLNGMFYDNNAMELGKPGIQVANGYVLVNSFNDWLSGTQIEPARNIPPPSSYTYLTYIGAFGNVENQSNTAYIRATAGYASNLV